MTDVIAEANPLAKARGPIGIALGIAVLGYLGYMIWSGFQETATELLSFRWSLYLPILALTVVNYGLRYLKWAWLLKRLGIDMPHRENLWGFVAGLGLVITPGKAGELIKPYVVKEVTGAPMSTTIPALFAERLTDGIAVILLAAISVGTYRPDKTGLILISLGAVGFGLLLLANDTLSEWAFRILDSFPKLRGVALKLREAHGALRTCLSPVALLWTLLLSLVAWWAECVGYWLVFVGLDVNNASLDLSTFLYAFATVFGAPSPGGMGMADLALVEGSQYFVEGLSEPTALAATLLVRVATLWFGVLLGAGALLSLGKLLDRTPTPPEVL